MTKGGGRKPEGERRPRRGKNKADLITSHLRQVYDGVAEQELPDNLKSLVEQLKQVKGPE